ncbi:hypothetical protein J437_LFUL013229 [Ladona fulva]|uniref:Uncharacterized protein n=1 Tax=Ladona fulva TaxID=123851 RepID=A0A8K0K6D2_LADFU|nr:hypothetical protein J437_LFUL013229 [Ladona fulva]
MEAVFKLLPIKEILRVFRAGALATREILDSVYAGVVYRVTEMEESVNPEEIGDFLCAAALDNTPFLQQGSSSSPLPTGISSHGSFIDIAGNTIDEVEMDLGLVSSPPPKDRSLSDSGDLAEAEFCDIHENSGDLAETDFCDIHGNSGDLAETDFLYEFHGCYFHGCVHCFNGSRNEKISNSPLETMDMRYKATLKKSALLRGKGYEVVEMWECNFDRMIRDNRGLSRFIEANPLSTEPPKTLETRFLEVGQTAYGYTIR